MAFEFLREFLYNRRAFLLPLPRELREYPGARTFRTTFGKKLTDTFFAFAGKLGFVSELSSDAKLAFPYPKSWLSAKHPRMGIFDYLTLGIPRLATKLFEAANYVADKGYDNSLAWIPGVLGYIVNHAILLPLRYLTAAAATLVVSPLVLGIYIVSSVLGNNTYNRALEIVDMKVQSPTTTLSPIK